MKHENTRAGHQRRTGLLTLGLCLALSCSSGSTGTEGAAALIDNELWERVAPENDPYDGEIAEEPFCLESAWKAELSSDRTTAFEVDMKACNFFTGRQALLTDLDAGDVVQVRFWHDDLRASEPAETVLRLRIAGVDVWERRIPIPGAESSVPPQLISDQFEIESATSAGLDVLFHVHNHGDNSYLLLGLERME